MSNQRKKSKGRFAGVPIPIMESSSYVTLPPLAKCLLFELACQYNGKNNGYLSLTREDLKHRGYKSPNSTTKAINALIEANLLVLTRQGGIAKGRQVCNLYALNWQPIDEKSNDLLENTNQPKGGLINWLQLNSKKVKILQR